MSIHIAIADFAAPAARKLDSGFVVEAVRKLDSDFVAEAARKLDPEFVAEFVVMAVVAFECMIDPEVAVAVVPAEWARVAAIAVYTAPAVVMFRRKRRI